METHSVNLIARVGWPRYRECEYFGYAFVEWASGKTKRVKYTIHAVLIEHQKNREYRLELMPFLPSHQLYLIDCCKSYQPENWNNLYKASVTSIFECSISYVQNNCVIRTHYEYEEDEIL